MEVLNFIFSSVHQHYFELFQKTGIVFFSVMVIFLVASLFFLWCPEAEALSNKEQCYT